MVFTRPCVAVLIPDRASDPDGYVNPPFLCFIFLLMLFFFLFFLNLNTHYAILLKKKKNFNNKITRERDFIWFYGYWD